MSRPAVLLDRDGTINEDVGYPGRWSQIRIYPWSIPAVGRLNEAGFAVVIATNQSGVGRGIFTEDDLRRIHDRMTEAFFAGGARIDAIYYCPHYRLSTDPRYRRDCLCRKPGSAMGRQAAADLDLDLARSFMIGDKVEDVEFGRGLGATPVLVMTGYGAASRRRLEAAGPRPAAVAAHLGEAVDWIFSRLSAVSP
ncbi:MAG: HAD family hydrolase [Candidatus Aminicenantes bacterium]|nr:HAD family hydrolase [Candidatus Aminicenantes bacterium]